MEKSIQRAIEKLENKGWITINENLNPEAVTKEIIQHMKEMKLIDFIKSFSPSELRN